MPSKKAHKARRIPREMTSYPADAGFQAKYFKSFGDELVGIENVLPINVIIGRNNSGKSALIDTIRFFTNPKAFDPEYQHKGRESQFFITKKLTTEEIEKAFSRHASGGSIGINHFTYGSRWLGQPITIQLGEGKRQFVKIDPPFESDPIKNQSVPALTEAVINPLQGKVFRKLAAERDIKPESDDASDDPSEKGDGVTNLIQRFLNKAELDRSIVEVRLLQALNQIFSPDCIFDRILVRQRGNGAWEIFLDEKTKGLIPLSQSGSGIKTVMLVLVNILLVPKRSRKELSDFVFAFEELENNLHPGLQRRLLNYIRTIALEKNCCFFLTTHSNVVIDLFSKGNL